MGNDPPRQPHAVPDLASRNWKALKIERLLDLQARKQRSCPRFTDTRLSSVCLLELLGAEIA